MRPARIADGFAGLVGNTPLVRLRSLSERTGCNVLAKAEWLNPGGSVKDRAALSLVRDALKRKGGIDEIVEGTAGNTGIGLAHVCNSLGLRLSIFMPNTQSQEKIDTLRMLGATVNLVPAVAITDPAHYNFQARDYAAMRPNSFFTSQFDNTANRDVHYVTTGPEIWEQTDGSVDAFTCATGTGGTLAGTARYLKEASNGRVKVVLADPPGSVLYSHVTSGGTKLDRSGSSITEGIGQGRITSNMHGVLEAGLIDSAVLIPDDKTIKMVYRLLKDEGIFVGASSALNAVAAEEVAKQLGPGHTVVTVLCDGASRYASRLFSKKWLDSKGLLEHIPDDCRSFVSLE